LERPDSLDDLIPIEEWALDGQPDAGIQPQTSRAVDGPPSHHQGASAEQPQAAAIHGAGSLIHVSQVRVLPPASGLAVP
jgi:hypothetical protein